MVSSTTFSLLRFIFNCNSKKLKLVQIHFTKENSAKSFKIGVLAKRFWYLILVVSLAITIVDFCSTVRSSSLNFSILCKSLYHGFLLLTKFATYSNIYVFYKESTEIAHFLNCLSKRNSLLCSKKLEYKTKSKLTLFTVLVFACAISIFLVFLVILPTIALILPGLHNSGILGWYFDSCNTYYLRLYLFSSQVLFLLPITAFAPVFSTTCLVTLKVICESMEKLRYLIFCQKIKIV